METPTPSATQTRTDRHIWSWCTVRHYSTGFQESLFSNFDDSICIVTIVRITKLVAAVSSSHSSDPTTLSLTPDASYDLCNIAFWTLLEPLLGTICCCLPVLQPAIKKFSEMMTMMTTRRHATPSSYGSSSSSSSGKPKTAPKQKRHRSFQRMTEDGIFPLVELEREVYAVYDQDSTMEIPSPSAQGILVRQEWGVSSV